MEGGGWDGPREQDLGSGGEGVKIAQFIQDDAGLWGTVCWLWGQLIDSGVLVREGRRDCKASVGRTPIQDFIEL